jgi:hypothetical protein
MYGFQAFQPTNLADAAMRNLRNEQPAQTHDDLSIYVESDSNLGQKKEVVIIAD